MRFTKVILLVLLFASRLEAQVSNPPTFVGTGSSSNTAAGTLSTSNITVTTSSTDALLCFLMLRNAASTISVARYDDGGTNQNLTLIGSAFTTGTGTVKTWIYGLLNPADAVSKAVLWNFSTTTEAATSCLYLQGVDQGALAASITLATTTGNDTAPTIVIPSAANNLTVAVAAADSASPSISSATQTSWLNVNSLSNQVIGGTYATTTGASNTHTFTLSGGGPYQWAIGGINIYAVGQVPAAGGTSRGMMPTGAGH